MSTERPWEGEREAAERKQQAGADRLVFGFFGCLIVLIVGAVMVVLLALLL